MLDTHRRIWGGGRGGLGPPLEKSVSLAGHKLELGRTEMGAWQDRNGKLGKRLFVKLLILQLFLSFFVWFLPLLVGFCHISLFSSTFACFAAIYLSFLPIGRTAW